MSYFALTRLTGDGSTKTFTIGFNYRAQADVVVTLNSVVQQFGAHYTFASPQHISFVTAPVDGANIEFRRSTSQSTRLVDYAAGAVFKESDLDTDSEQGFCMTQ